MVSVQAFEELRKNVEKEITALRSEVVKIPEFLKFKQGKEEEEQAYRAAADKDIKTFIQEVRTQFQIESQQTNEKLEMTIAEVRSRDDAHKSAMDQLNNKMDQFVKEAQFPRARRTRTQDEAA